MNKWIVILFFLVFLGYGLYGIFIKDLILERSSNYTIGISKGVKTMVNRSNSIIVEYKVKSYSYQTLIEEKPDMLSEGGYFVVQFSENNPEISRVLDQYRINKIVDVPENGWDNIEQMKESFREK